MSPDPASSASADADWLDDAWDAAIDATPSDPVLTAILRALRATDPATAPDPRWLHDLEKRLMPTTASPHHGVSPRPLHRAAVASTVAPPPAVAPRSAPRLAPILATAALLLVMAVIGLAAIRGSHRPSSAVTAPSVAQSTVAAGLQSVTCRIEPRTGQLPTGTPRTASIFPLPVDGTPQEPSAGTPLPAREGPADRATIEGIAMTLAEVHACQVGGDDGRLLALFSPDLLRRTGGQPLRWRVPAPDAYRLDNVLMFVDGRAMATLVEPSMTGAFVVLTQQGDRWLIDEVAILRPSPIPTAVATPQPTCAAAALPPDLAPPAVDTVKPAGLFPFDANRSIVAGPFPTDVFTQPPFNGVDADPLIAAAVNDVLSSLRACAATDSAAREMPDVRNPVEPSRVLAFFSPDLLARGRIDVLPDPWWDAYPIAFGWEDWRLPAATVRRLAGDRVLVLLDSATSPTDHAALVMVPGDGRWLIDEIAFVTDDPSSLNPAGDCTLAAPAAPRPAPDWAQPPTNRSVLPDPMTGSDPFETTLADEQRGRTPATIAASAALPSGSPVDAAARAGIAAAITDLITCRDVADFPQRMGRRIWAYPRFFDRFSDDLFRRYQPMQPLAARWWDSFSSLQAISPDELDPSWLDSLQGLPDGRVLAVLTTNRPDRPHQVMVFVDDDGRWLLDEFAWLGGAPSAPAPAPTSPGGAPTAPTSVVITLADIIFTPNQITIPARQEATLTLVNEGVVVHSFVVADLGLDQEVAPGASVNVRIAAPAGSYRVICDIPGHEEAGMVAVLDVVDPSATPIT